MVFEAHRDAACPAVPFTITHARAHKSGQSFWSFCARVYPPVVRVSLSGEGAVDLLFLIEDRAREEEERLCGIGRAGTVVEGQHIRTR